MKKVGVTGYKGKLGGLLVRRPNFVSLDCDILDILSIEKAVKYTKPDLIVNCACISSVDECEKNPDRANKVNVTGLANLHRVFGDKVVNISSDQVFSGRSYFLPKEETLVSPINAYGWSKVGAESVSRIFGGKTLRLSRTVSISNPDINYYIGMLQAQGEVEVPSFIFRNYIHQDYAIDGIEYFVTNYDTMPEILNYGGEQNVRFSSFIGLLADAVGVSYTLVNERTKDNPHFAPRPKRGGFNVSLAKKLGMPMYKISDTVSLLASEVENV